MEPDVCDICGHPTDLVWGPDHPGMCGYIDADGPCFCPRMHKRVETDLKTLMGDTVAFDKDTLGGVCRIPNHRISVAHLFAHLVDGFSLDEYCREYSLHSREVIPILNKLAEIFENLK
jgi:uncharacterized protein (DUF433 family)